MASSDDSVRTFRMMRKMPRASVSGVLPLLGSTRNPSMRCAAALPGLSSVFMNVRISDTMAARRLRVLSFLPKFFSRRPRVSWMKSAMRRRAMFRSCGCTLGSTLVTPLWKMATPPSMRGAQMPADRKVV